MPATTTSRTGSGARPAALERGGRELAPGEDVDDRHQRAYQILFLERGIDPVQPRILLEPGLLVRGDDDDLRRVAHPAEGGDTVGTSPAQETRAHDEDVREQ